MHLHRESSPLAFDSPTVLNVERNSWDVPERFEMGRSRSMTEQIHRQRQDVWGLPYVAVRRKGGQCNSDWRARDMILRHHGTMEPRRHAEPRCQLESNQAVVWLWISADLAHPLSISFGVSPLDGMSWRRTAISRGSLDRGPHVRRMDSGRRGPLHRKRTRRGRSLNQPGRRRVETPQRRRRRIGLPGLRTKQWPGQCGRGGDDWIGWCRTGGMTSAAPRGLQLTGGTVCMMLDG